MTGKLKGLGYSNTLKAVALIAAALILFSCQKDQLENNRIILYPVIENKIETAVMTRAAGDPIDETAFTEYSSDDRQALTVQAVAFQPSSNTRAADKDDDGTFSPIGQNEWRSGVEVELSYSYNLYVYSQAMPASATPQFTYDGSNTSLTFNGLQLLTTIDPLVCVAAKGALLEDNPDPSDYPTLIEGNFGIGTINRVVNDNVVEKTTKAFLALEHLYSKASMSFKIDDTYSQIRTIRIKDVQISTPEGTLTGTHTYTFANNSLNIPTGNNITTGGNSAQIDLFDGPTSMLTPQENQDYITLTTQAQTFGYFYFLPLNPLKPMSLTVTYDVYDLAGNPTRQNQTVTNNNLFAGISYNNGKAERNHEYQINVTVSPTYLYVLSDDDVDLKLELTVQ